MATKQEHLPFRQQFLDNLHYVNPLHHIKKPEALQCSICLLTDADSPERFVWPDNTYHHAFCESCIRLWLERNNTCPMCRNVLFDQPVVDVDSDDKMTDVEEEALVLFNEVGSEGDEESEGDDDEEMGDAEMDPDYVPKEDEDIDSGAEE